VVRQQLTLTNTLTEFTIWSVTSETREAILDAAVSCFAERGYKKASIDAIAEQAGVGKGTVYLYCESKQDLFYQSVHRELRDWVGEVSRMIDPRVRADQLMLHIGMADVEFLEKRPLVRELLFGAYHGLLPEWSARFEELRALGQRAIRELIELGIKQGIFAADLDVEATARILQDMQLSANLLARRTGEDLVSVRRHQRAALRLVMQGLMTR
jgi:AcrR family transcriptional regulator